jgi:hypothetical protein
MQDEVVLEPMPEPQMCEGPAKEWRPSNQEALREHDIRIHFLHRGCVVHVGCKQIAFEDVSRAMAELNEYVSGDTWEVQQKWRKLLDS